MAASPIRRLEDVRLEDAAEVGGKAANLGELLAAGFRVPDGVVLTIAGAALEKEERDAALRGEAVQLGPGRFAVRSSAIGEDGDTRSFAGLFESILDAAAADLPDATDQVLRSVRSVEAGAYGGVAGGGMAVVVQRMVDAVAAGVALTADPITGDRGTTVVTAVRGLGARLVGGETPGDEWIVRDRVAHSRRQPERAINRHQALAIAQVATQIAAGRGAPQDVEWAIDGSGELWIVQARPMTAVPREVRWDPPARGAFSRSYRFGEWLSEPVTPLFETWLLTRMEERLHAGLLAALGQGIARPYHVLVNGWYFYTVNWMSPAAFLRNAPRMLVRALRSPRSLAGILPATVRYAYPVVEREWRDDLQPRYRATVRAADARLDTASPGELPALIDELADLAGEYFLSIAALSGAAYKAELHLAGFHRRHLRGGLGWSHLPLVSGFEAVADLEAPALVSLDWWFEPMKLDPGSGASEAVHASVVDAREKAEAAAHGLLSASPRRLAAFRRSLSDAQHLLVIRDEQTRELAIAWPVMRRAVLKIGQALTERGWIDDAEDVFFLSRAEALDALRGAAPAVRIDVTGRRALREEQARLVPPLVVGRLPPMAERLWTGFAARVGAVRSERALVSGAPASSGRATGVVRVVRGPDEFETLQVGEILVAPMTAPAWTPLFARAAGLVTDIGSAASHASLVAREYGIPAVVGTGDATARLRTGMRVTVDGGTGTVEAA